MNNAKKTYFAKESYYIFDGSTYGRVNPSFILYKERVEGLEEYKGWYLRSFNCEKPATCYDYYNVVKNIINGKIDDIKQQIDQIRVILDDDIVLMPITPKWSDEEILRELSKCFWKEL